MLVVVTILAAVFLFTPYEVFLEGGMALAIVLAAVVGFLMHPRREVYYVRTAVRLIDPDRRPLLEHDFLAVRVELVRLWLLFVPTFLSVAVLVFFAASGPAKFSYLNWVFSSRYASIVLLFCQYPPLLVFALLVAWIDERRVMRDAGACSAKSFSIHRAPVGWIGRVSYQFVGEHGEYCGGDCLYFGLHHPRELATIVFHNVQTPELNKIVMGFLFHRLIIMGRGVTDLDSQTAAAQTALAEATPLS
ncbi:MAG: hypothetical protein WA817_10210 [Candidatus Acidiferrum sp.]